MKILVNVKENKEKRTEETDFKDRGIIVKLKYTSNVINCKKTIS